MSVTIATNNAAWNYSPSNWRFNGSTYAESNNPGAYAQIGFTGTSVALLVDVTPLSSAGYAAGKYPYIRTRVDGGSWTETLLASGNTSVSIATGLAAGNHTFEVGFVFVDAAGTDRWTVPSLVFRITGISIDDGASAVTFTPKQRRILVFGNSIEEAVWFNTSYNTGSAFQTFIPALATALGAEVGAISFQSQGYARTGVGNVPPLITPGDAPNSAWNLLSAGNARTFSNINQVYCFHGTNDGLNGVSDATVTARVTAFINSVRAACGAATQIIIVVPPGQYKASAISTGVSNAADARSYFINTGSTNYQKLADGVHLTELGEAEYFNGPEGFYPLVIAALEKMNFTTFNATNFTVG